MVQIQANNSISAEIGRDMKSLDKALGCAYFLKRQKVCAYCGVALIWDFTLYFFRSKVKVISH